MHFNIAIVVATTALGIHARPQDPILPLTPFFTKQCEITLIEWTGGIAPYGLVIVRDGEVIEQFSNIPAAPVNFVEGIFPWGTNVAAGTEVRMLVSDSTGAVAPTGLFTIMPGVNNCTLV
ncbi:hypothetical protein C8Q79DRAFT_339199 [Trametes meyenii]|nr:hypothetical protein C8Q79DRAFT_339199 [Trametes meyenii]